MTKLFSNEIEEMQSLQAQLQKLESERDANQKKAEELNGELFALRERRDDLEKIISRAPAMLLDGSLSNAEYFDNKKELLALFEDIDQKDELFAIFDKSITDDYQKNYAQLTKKLNDKRSQLLSKYAKKLAFDIVEKCELQIIQMLAILPVNSLRSADFRGMDLGEPLIYALDHEPDGSLKKRDPGENKKIVADIFGEMGLK